MRRWGIYESSSDFDKLAGQGAYDNLHLAPRMKFTSKVATGPTIPDIVMAPFCINDCFNTHTRWGTLNGGLPESNQGFSGRVPYQVSGAPLVPGNQTVWISLTKTGSTTGFGIPSSAKPEDQVTHLLELYAKCRAAVESPLED